MNKVLTFGEILLRLTPCNYSRFSQANLFKNDFGGAEANVCVLLSNLNVASKFVTKLPNNDIAKGAINFLNQFNVDTSDIVLNGERMGIYFLEQGSGYRPSKVIYDRKYSAFSLSDKSDYDWENIFKDVSWFHLSGITLALNDVVFDICLNTVKIAKQKNIKISFDINYRKSLWSKEQAVEKISKIIPYVDVLIANEEHLQMIFNTYDLDLDRYDNNELTTNGYLQLCKSIFIKYEFEKLFITMRRSISSNHNKFSGMCYTKEDYYFGKWYDIVDIVDRVGSGDSFTAGAIYGIISNYNIKNTVEFAISACVLKHTINGDVCILNKEEIENLAFKSSSSKIDR